MRVRDAEPSALAALAAIKPGAALHRDRMRAAKDGPLRYLVVEEGGGLLAFGLLLLGQPDGWPRVTVLPQALDLHVREDRRSQGMGTYLIQQIYRGVSRAAMVFVMEVARRPIGECWLQEMNLPRILARCPWGARLQRIDLMIGAKGCWGRGYGTRAMALLVRHAFEHDRADAVFACDVAAANPRSERAVRRAGFVPFLAREGPKGRIHDYVLRR